MRRAGARIRAEAFKLTFVRIAGNDRYCAFDAKRRPTAFDELLRSVRRALAAEGLKDEVGYSPHITLSYWGAAVTRSRQIKPVEWWIDHVLLARGVGNGVDYHYDVIER